MVLGTLGWMLGRSRLVFGLRRIFSWLSLVQLGVLSVM
jgi:hypothetical protein